MKKLFITFVLIANFCSCSKLPPNFKKCNRRENDFNTCLSAAIENNVRLMNHPFKELGLPSLHPLVVPSLTIPAGQGPVAFSQKYKNLKVGGFGEIRCPKAEINFEKGTIFVGCFTPSSKLEFDYEIKGRLLLLPIFGEGPGSITLGNLNETFLFNFEEYQKRNKKFYRITNAKISMEPGLMTFDLKNLFNGEETLAKTVLMIMNENWREVYSDVKASYEEAFAQVFSAIYNNMLSKIPAEDIFGA